MTEQYLINGVNVETYLEYVRVLDGFMGVPTPLQQDYLVPGRTGAVATLPWIGPRTVTLGGVVRGATRVAYQENLRQFMRLAFNSGREMTMRRVLDVAVGTRTADARARYLGGLESVDQLSNRTGRVAADFSLLDAFWYDTQTITSTPKSGSFSLDVKGDAPTTKVNIAFSGGSSQRLTNFTSGDWVEFDGSTSSHDAVLKVDLFTATQNSANVISSVAANTANSSFYWMVLLPGVNTFTLTGGGTVDLVYSAAWL